MGGFPGSSDGKASAYKAGDLGSIPGSGRSPGEGNGNTLQYSCLENPTDQGAWWATAHRVAKRRTRLSDWSDLIWSDSDPLLILELDYISFLLLSCSSFYILVPVRYRIYKHFISFYRLTFYFLEGFYWRTKVFNLTKSNLFFLLLLVLLVSYWRNHCLIQGHEDYVYFLLKV